MNAILQTAPTDDTSPGFARVLFGRSHDGFPVALVGDNAFAMVPGKDGRHYLATGWRIARPLDEWTRSGRISRRSSTASMKDMFRCTSRRSLDPR